MLFTNWLQKVKELAKLSLISNFKPFGIDSERVVSHKKLTNSWVAKVLDWAHTFFVKFHCSEIIRFIVQYSGIISWLIRYKTVGLCNWDQNCKQRVTCISWSKVHILLYCLIYKLCCNGWRNTVLILIFSFLCQFHHCLQA